MAGRVAYWDGPRRQVRTSAGKPARAQGSGVLDHTRARGTIQKTLRQDVRIVHVRMAFVVLQPTSWMPSAQTHTEHSTVTRESESLPYDNRMHLVSVKLTDGQIVSGVSRKLQATRTQT